MARPTKQRPPVKQEAEEMEAQEMGETSEEETREGTEDGPSAKTNRKRSPKGAKNTKAPMDADCGICKSNKPCSCKAKKDGGCGSYGKKMDRNDALTPQEYLAACDLGIQDRSRPYIRARLDSAARLDLKCGAGSISEGEKCTKGTAQKAQQVQKGGGVRGALENAAIVGGTAGALFSYGQVVGHALKGNFGGASKALQREGAFLALSGAGMKAKGNRTGDKDMKGRGNSALLGAATTIGAGHLMGGGYTKSLGSNLSGISPSDIARNTRVRTKKALANLSGIGSAAKSNVTFRTKKSQFERMYKSPGRRDSAFATGFTPDFDQLAI
jgi:hypothetical protein